MAGAAVKANKDALGADFDQRVYDEGSGSGPFQPVTQIAKSDGVRIDPATATDVGARADAAASSDTGMFSIIALIKRGLQNWTTLLARVPALGQGTMAASMPVVLASNQSTLNVTTVPVAASIATGQVSVTTSATLIVAARSGRKSVIIINEGATDVRLGVSGVTTGNGVLLYGQKGAGQVIDGGAAVYGIVGSGSQSVSYVEAY